MSMLSNKKDLMFYEEIIKPKLSLEEKSDLLKSGYMLPIGIRMSDKVNKFDDYIGLVINWNGKLFVRLYPGTTKPGSYYLLNPLSKLGTAILPIGLHKDLWTKGLHKRKYKALVQSSPVKLYRDNDGDLELDYNNLFSHTVRVGINLHRASKNYQLVKRLSILESYNVDKWSAGCQVIASAKHFEYFMWWVKQSNNTFYNYLLMDNYDLNLKIKTKFNGSLINF